MFEKIKNRVNQELLGFTKDLSRIYSLSKISPILAQNIKSYILRDGKRARPILFVMGYLGFAKNEARGLYRSSLSIELLHDFMLIHDDIIDKSSTRRGLPSMHIVLDEYIKKYKGIKFNGKDLAIVMGDVMYAMAIDTFLAIKVDPMRKEKGLKKFIEAAFYTGSGEFIELLYGAKPLEEISRAEIYKVYNYKTAYYTFACPLSIGAILAGASDKQIDLITRFGLALGKAFQIKDDILGIFGEEEETGKSALADLQEAKKTILIWQAFNNAKPGDKNKIRNIMAKKKITRNDLSAMRQIIIESGALSYARKEIKTLLNQALPLIKSSALKPAYKNFLYNFSKEILA